MIFATILPYNRVGIFFINLNECFNNGLARLDQINFICWVIDIIDYYNDIRKKFWLL